METRATVRNAGPALTIPNGRDGHPLEHGKQPAGTRPSERGRRHPANERGVALVMAILIMLVMTGLAAILMNNVTSVRKLSGHQVTETVALRYAEAGVAEAMARISNGGISFGNNPKATALIFNASSLPAVGTDTTALATGQLAGAWLTYSTSNKSPDVLTVTYKTDAARTVIYRYDGTKTPPVQTTSGSPIYVIRSVGRSGSDARTVVSEVYQEIPTASTFGAVVCDQSVTWSGNDFMCGYNHRSDTPTGKGKNGRLGAGGCWENALLGEWETNIANKAGMWSSSTISGSGLYASGVPPTSPSQPGFYAGPWAVLGMTASDFWTWVGPPQSAAPGVPTGILYLDNNGIKQDQSGSFTFTGGDGEGILYVDGDLTLNGNFHYRGLIYVEGNLSINSWSWILGSLIVRGNAPQNWHSNGTILYSSDTIAQMLTKYSGKCTAISYRQL